MKICKRCGTPQNDTRFFWWWNTIRYRIRYNDELVPSAFDAACMKFFKYAGFVIGTAALAYSAWMYF